MNIRIAIALAALSSLAHGRAEASPKKSKPAIDAPYKGTCTGERVIYRGRCITVAALKKQFLCPAGATLRTDASSLMLELSCELPSKEKVGDFVSWIRTPDATGYIWRWIRHDRPNAGLAKLYHAGSHKPHQVYAVASGKMNGRASIYDVKGTLRERLNRKDDLLHGLSEEFSEVGALVTTRCIYRGHLLWRVDNGKAPAEACPPMGFTAASIPSNAKQQLFALGEGYPRDLGALAANSSDFYVSMNRPGGAGIFLLEPKGQATEAKSAKEVSLGSELDKVARPSEEHTSLGFAAKLVVPLDFEAKHLRIAKGRAFFEVNYDLATAPLRAGAKAKVLVKNVQVSSLAIDGRHVYFANRLGPDEDTPKAPATGIWRVGLDGKGLVLLAKASDEPRGLSLVVSGDSVYWADEVAETISRTPKRGGRTKVVHRGDEPRAIALDGKHLLWSEAGHSSPYAYFPSDTGGAIFRMPLDGSQPAKMLVAAGEQALRITCDRTHFYWSSSYGLMRMARAGGDPQYLTTRSTETRDLVLRSGFVYWLDRYSHEVARMDKRARQRQVGEPL